MNEGRRGRSLAFWVRWLHVYVSMVGFLALLLFAVTGLTLNHAEFFEGGAESVREGQGAMDAAWLAADGDDERIDRLAIVEALRARHAVHGAVSDFVVDEDEIVVLLKGPGYSADAAIDRHAGSYTLTETRRGVMTILDDLHKGRDSGGAWSWAIDVSAVLMTATSLTGIWLLLYLKKRRRDGLLVALLGGITLVVVYLLGVP